MAAEGDVDLDLEADENCTGKPAEKPRKHDSGAADLERVTDYAEEKEISSSDLETVRVPASRQLGNTRAATAGCTVTGAEPCEVSRLTNRIFGRTDV